MHCLLFGVIKDAWPGNQARHLQGQKTMQTTTQKADAIRRDIDTLSKKHRALVAECEAKRDAIRQAIAESQARISSTLAA